MSRNSMMKKRGREDIHCDSRHCPSPSDAQLTWFDAGVQRRREDREWRKDWTDD